LPYHFYNHMGPLIHRALLDLGASVNLIPFSEHEMLGLGELKAIKIALMACSFRR